MDVLDQLCDDSDPSGLWRLTSIDDHFHRVNRDLNLLVLQSMTATLTAIGSSNGEVEEAADQVRFCCNYALVALVDRLYLALKALAVNVHSRLITPPVDLDPAAYNATLQLLHIEPQINLKLNPSDPNVKIARDRLRGARDARNLIVHDAGRLVSEEGNSGFIVDWQPPSRAACDNFGNARP